MNGRVLSIGASVNAIIIFFVFILWNFVLIAEGVYVVGMLATLAVLVWTVDVVRLLVRLGQRGLLGSQLGHGRAGGCLVRLPCRLCKVLYPLCTQKLIWVLVEPADCPRLLLLLLHLLVFLDTTGWIVRRRLNLILKNESVLGPIPRKFATTAIMLWPTHWGLVSKASGSLVTRDVKLVLVVLGTLCCVLRRLCC